MYNLFFAYAFYMDMKDLKSIMMNCWEPTTWKYIQKREMKKRGGFCLVWNLAFWARMLHSK
jgi:hypothetical protein